MASSKRSYDRSELTEILKKEGTTSTEFAKWLGCTKEGVSKRFKREMEKFKGGVSKELYSCLTVFLAEKRGIKFKIDVFGYK